jgi:tripartite-type tricarboxylate transporter receptor subunit TctC
MRASLCDRMIRRNCRGHQLERLVAPAKTPDAVVARLNAEVTAALGRPKMVEKLALDSSEPLPSSPERFAEFLLAEHAKWGALIRGAGIKLE